MTTLEGPSLPENNEPVLERFVWRDYMHHLGDITEGSQKKLDTLEDFINQGGPESREFLHALRAGEYRKPVLSLVQFFRDILEPDERARLLDEIRRSGPLGSI